MDALWTQINQTLTDHTAPLVHVLEPLQTLQNEAKADQEVAEDLRVKVMECGALLFHRLLMDSKTQDIKAEAAAILRFCLTWISSRMSPSSPSEAAVAVEYSPFHLPLVMAALVSKHLDLVLPVLERDFTDIRDVTDVVDILRYFYYSGIVCLALKRYERAKCLLESGLAVPSSHAISAFAVEAYKKYKLASLLAGSPDRDPILLADSAQAWKNSASMRPYNQLHALLTSTSPFKLLNAPAEIERDKIAFVADGNWELVQQCLRLVPETIVKRLVHVYMSLSIAEVTRLTGLESEWATEQLLARMIYDGAVRARLDSQQRLVQFHGQHQTDEQHGTLQKLNMAVQSLTQLNGRMADLDQQLIVASGKSAEELAS